jgi:hypothetical protein
MMFIVSTISSFSLFNSHNRKYKPSEHTELMSASQHNVTALCKSTKIVIEIKVVALSFPNMKYVGEVGRMGAHLQQTGYNH